MIQSLLMHLRRSPLHSNYFTNLCATLHVQNGLEHLGDNSDNAVFNWSPQGVFDRPINYRHLNANERHLTFDFI